MTFAFVTIFAIFGSKVASNFTFAKVESTSLTNFENLKIPPPSSENGVRVPTLNNMGSMSMVEDPATKAFLDFIDSDPKSTYMEVACAYGYATKKAASRLTEGKLIANDLDPRHLYLLQNQYFADSPQYLKNVNLVTGDFPDDAKIRTLPSSSIKGVLLARVLHYFHGDKVERALQEAYRLLEPNGKMFINVLSPYMGTAQKAPQIIEENKKLGKKYPGEIENLEEQIGSQFGTEPFFHFFTLETLKPLIEKQGFVVDKAEYAPLLYKSKELQSAGKENIIIVATKPARR
jgi:SAM-dependent methyltransferase